MQYETSGVLPLGAAPIRIDKSRYEQVKTAKSSCLFALEIEEKFALLLDNYYEFECELLRLAEASLIWPHRDHQHSMQERLTLDRRLVNLLTACRLYLDQTDHGLSSLFGHSSRERDNVTRFKHELYEKHWGYRFMEALRDHVQHSRLPVRVIKYSWSAVPGKVAECTQVAVVPQTEPKTLAEDKKFKKTVLNELMGRGETVDLREPAREYVACFIELHDKIRETIDTRIRSDRIIYEAASTEYSEISGQKVEFPDLIEMNDDGTISERVALVTEFLLYYDSLRERNRANVKLTTTCASNSN